MKSKTKKVNSEKVIRNNIAVRCRKCKLSIIPKGCAACGGPYPLCKNGCPVFDDE